VRMIDSGQWRQQPSAWARCVRVSVSGTGRPLCDSRLRALPSIQDLHATTAAHGANRAGRQQTPCQVGVAVEQPPGVLQHQHAPGDVCGVPAGSWARLQSQQPPHHSPERPVRVQWRHIMWCR
jgi:hypothetical protein